MDISRQINIFDPDSFKDDVHVIGCGATGSWVALILSKIGVNNIHLYDFDTIEEHNIPNQFFSNLQNEEKKCEALKENIALFSCNDRKAEELKQNITSHDERITKDSSKMSGYVFLLVDTMSARKEIWENCIKLNPYTKLMIETRMGTNMGRIYCIDPMKFDSIEEYEKTLYSDEESDVSACGVSQTIAPTAILVAGYAVWQFLKFVNEGKSALCEETVFDTVGPNVYSRNFKK